MKTLEKHVQSLGNPPFSLPPKLVCNVESQFQLWWRMVKTNLHYVGTFLNPYLLKKTWSMTMLMQKRESSMLINVVSYVQALTDFVNLVKGWGSFVNIHVATSLNMPPHEWWDLIGVCIHKFTPMAKHILAQVCSTSSCEQTWNSYSLFA
jgi:hypothetical protein